MLSAEWRELARLAWQAAKTDTARARDLVGFLYRLHAEALQEAEQRDALESMQPTQETPADLVGALQDKVHADSGPFRAGRSVKETPSARPEHVAAHDCACAECVAAEPTKPKVRQNYAQRCTCKDYPGADEFCTAHPLRKNLCAPCRGSGKVTGTDNYGRLEIKGDCEVCGGTGQNREVTP